MLSWPPRANCLTVFRRTAVASTATVRIVAPAPIVQIAPTVQSLTAGPATIAATGLTGVPVPIAAIAPTVLIARTAGLVAHLAEEMRSPIGKPLWLETERRASGHE